jgi:hypothetical protein
MKANSPYILGKYLAGDICSGLEYGQIISVSFLNIFRLSWSVFGISTVTSVSFGMCKVISVSFGIWSGYFGQFWTWLG